MVDQSRRWKFKVMIRSKCFLIGISNDCLFFYDGKSKTFRGPIKQFVGMFKDTNSDE